MWERDWAEKILQNNSSLFSLSTLLELQLLNSTLFPACSMKSHCIIVITDKEKIGIEISLFPGSWEGDLHVVTRTGKQWVPQHIYMIPGFSYSHSVLRSQQWTGYLGTWKGFLLKVPNCLGAKGVWRIEAETRVEGSAIARRGCVGCVPSLGDFQGQDS